jgi:hypothetical protein
MNMIKVSLTMRANPKRKQRAISSSIRDLTLDIATVVALINMLKGRKI